MIVGADQRSGPRGEPREAHPRRLHQVSEACSNLVVELSLSCSDSWRQYMLEKFSIDKDDTKQ